MPAIERIGHSEYIEDESFERDLFLLSLPDIKSLDIPISLPSRHFVAFLAVDAVGIETHVLDEFFQKLISAGCAYFCAWGEDCERLHHIFHHSCYDVEPLIFTTSQDNESLDDALWFFAYVTFPDDGYSDTCRSALAISIANPEWDAQIRRRLSDLEAFNRDLGLLDEY